MTTYATVPDATGHFGAFGGRLAPEALMSALEELTAAYEEARTEPAFTADLAALLTPRLRIAASSPRGKARPTRAPGPMPAAASCP